jgi:hypothetical protein
MNKYQEFTYKPALLFAKVAGLPPLTKVAAEHIEGRRYAFTITKAGKLAHHAIVNGAAWASDEYVAAVQLKFLFEAAGATTLSFAEYTALMDGGTGEVRRQEWLADCLRVLADKQAAIIVLNRAGWSGKDIKDSLRAYTVMLNKVKIEAV